MTLPEQLQKLPQLLQGLQASIQRLFVPTPKAALDMRRRVVDRIHSDRPGGRIRLPFTPLPVQVWESDALATEGYTLQNAFSSLRVTVAPPAGVELFASLQGAYGSSWSEIGRAPVGMAGPGSYAVPLINGQSLSTDVRFVLLGHATQEDQHDVEIQLGCWVTLVAGLRF